MNAVVHALPAALLAAAAPPLPRMAAQGDAACTADPAQVPPHPTRHGGTVVGPVSPDRAEAATAAVERGTGATVSPDDADLPRVLVRVVEGRTAFATLAAVVGGPVEVLSRHRDPRSRCLSIPWTVGSAPAMS